MATLLCFVVAIALVGSALPSDEVDRFVKNIDFNVVERPDPSGRGKLGLECVYRGQDESVTEDRLFVDTVSIEAVEDDKLESTKLASLAAEKTPVLSDALKPTDALASGSISGGERRTILTLYWDYSKYSPAKLYMCRVSGEDIKGVRRSVVATAYSEVKKEPKDLEKDTLMKNVEKLAKNETIAKLLSLDLPEAQKKTLVEFFRVLTEQVSMLKNNIEELGKAMEEVSNERDTKDSNTKQKDSDDKNTKQRDSDESHIKQLESDFHVSVPRDGKAYVVDKKDSRFGLEKAQEACRKVGGYLIEVDDAGEFNHVVEWLRKIGGEVEHYQTGSKRTADGRWVGLYSGKELDVPFAEKLPGSDTNEEGDCLSILESKDGLTRTVCSVERKYICEIDGKN